MLDGAGKAKARMGAEPEFVGTVDIVICATKSPPFSARRLSRDETLVVRGYPRLRYPRLALFASEL